MSEPLRAQHQSWEAIEAEQRRELGVEPSSDKPGRRGRWRRRALLEWALAIGGAVLVAWAIQAYFVQAFVIPSASMEPTLVDRDRVLVNKLVGDPDRGDVVVFRRPPDLELDDVDDLIKRVIGVGGDTVEARDGQVWVNGFPIIEGYLDPGASTDDFGPIEVPDDHLFVMGDNRVTAMSLDSRFFGPIPEDLVVGRAFAIVWPLSRLSTL